MQRKPNLFDFIIDRPRLSIITGILLIVAGILVSDLPKMIATLGWSTTSGTITSHHIQKVRIKEYDGDFYEEIHVYIRYEYAVNGTTYETNSINTRNLPFYPPETAENYPLDKEVTVYYNPKQPSKAVLEPGFVDVFKAFNIFFISVFCRSRLLHSLRYHKA